MGQSPRPPRTGITRALAACALFAVPALIWSGCGSDDEGSGCTPGETQTCNCTATETGVQACSEDGASFAACNCNATGTSGAGGGGGSAGASNVAGNGGTGSTMMEAPFTGATGLPCETDDDCFGGLTCLPSTSAENPFGTGGVQRGICTAPCGAGQAGSDTCTSVDSLSDCIVFGEDTEGFCLPLCPVAIASAQRCGGRPDMACITSNGIDETGQIGICRPQCSSDVDCAGRSCDLGTGFCVDALPTRGPGVIGAACNEMTEETDCITGFCIGIEEDNSGFCTAACVLGSRAGCGFSADASPLEAACFPVSQNALVGDRGVCLELCDVPADCAQAGYTCIEQIPEAQAELGRFGACLPPEEGAADAGAADGG